MEEKVAIITGGSSGIGRASALALTTQGFKVLITGRRADRLDMVAAAHTKIETLVADSAVPASAGQIVAAAIERWGRIDVLVNNAGAGERRGEVFEEDRCRRVRRLIPQTRQIIEAE
jgi:NADP-dependent 3-hydroxy acid dehydrogenase YdfG